MSTFHTPFFRSELILRRGLTFLYFFHPDLPIHCGQTCVLFDGVLSDHHDRGTKRATKTNENCPVNIYIHPTASRKCSSPCLASSSLIDTYYQVLARLLLPPFLPHNMSEKKKPSTKRKKKNREELIIPSNPYRTSTPTLAPLPSHSPRSSDQECRKGAKS